MNVVIREIVLTAFLLCKPRKYHKALFTTGYVISTIETMKVSGVTKTSLQQPDNKTRVVMLVPSTDSLSSPHLLREVPLQPIFISSGQCF